MDQDQGSVAEYVTRFVPIAGPENTVGEILSKLHGQRFDSVDTVYILDDDKKLIGAARLGEIYAASKDVRVRTLMLRSPPSVPPNLDQEDAASFAIRHDISAVPVVGADDRFLGVFPARAIMQVLRQEHLEDLHHMAGIWHHSEEARRSLEASPARRVQFRLPWLLVGLAGSMAAAGLVAQFEHVLKAEIAVAFFIPAIVYLADAVGTQSEAVAVRGLSLTQARIGKLLLGELSTGLVMGLALALLAATFTALVFADVKLMLAVAISIVAACSLATTIGLFLPWVFARTGWDPALASGPIATIVQDVLSLLIYFGTVSLLFL